jgi:hypothetical protein
MATLTTIPVRITDEVAAHVDKLGLQGEMEQMIDHMKRTVVGLRSILVTYEENPENTLIDPLVVLCGYEEPSVREPGDVSLELALDRWVVQAFPPEVGSRFVTTLTTGDPDGR